MKLKKPRDNSLLENERVQCQFADRSLPLAVVVAQTRWDEPPRMRHDVTRQLMRWFNVLFVEFLPTETTSLAESVWRHEGDRLLIYKPKAPCPASPRLYANDPLTHKVVNHYFTKLIVKAARSLFLKRPILFNFVYDLPEIMVPNLFSYKAYVCFDEFPRMQRRAYKRNPLKAWYQAVLFQHYENQVARRANRCFTPHYPLREKLSKVNPNVDMLFHAHNYPVPAAHSPRPRTGIINVGFAGYINYRLISEWLFSVLQQDGMILHLVGPLHNGNELDKFGKYPNLQYVPPLKGTQLREKLFEMDVLIMPYNPLINEVQILTTNSKIFQCIAACKPIVISNLPNYIEMPEGIIYKAKDKVEFVDQIRRSYIDDCEEYVALRCRIAQENTWDKRGDMLYATIQRGMDR